MRHTILILAASTNRIKTRIFCFYYPLFKMQKTTSINRNWKFYYRRGFKNLKACLQGRQKIIISIVQLHLRPPFKALVNNSIFRKVAATQLIEIVLKTGSLNSVAKINLLKMFARKESVRLMKWSKIFIPKFLIGENNNNWILFHPVAPKISA
jgi:hypothetical protein